MLESDHVPADDHAAVNLENPHQRIQDTPFIHPQHNPNAEPGYAPGDIEPAQVQPGGEQSERLEAADSVQADPAALQPAALTEPVSVNVPQPIGHAVLLEPHDEAPVEPYEEEPSPEAPGLNGPDDNRPDELPRPVGPQPDRP